MLKEMIKGLLPTSTLQWFRRRRAEKANRRIAGLPPSEAFDLIYRNGWWGDSTRPSGHGSYGIWADAFVEAILKLVHEHGWNSVADIGCGDFNVGRRLAPHVESYLGLDVSKVIVERNRKLFASMKTVCFETFDLIEARPPTPISFSCVRCCNI
ncbi:MAG: hypothetical protein AAF192_00050 [Pseudomonadota bacterium]